LKAVSELKSLFPSTGNLAPLALQWILNFKEVSCIIPGASKVDHVLSNISIYKQPPLSAEQIQAMNNIYDKYIRNEVHYLW